MARNLDLAPVLGFSLFVQQERRALYPHVFPAVAMDFSPQTYSAPPRRFPHPTRARSRSCLARNLSWLATGSLETPSTSARRLEVGGERREGQRLLGAARGVVLGIEIEHDLAAAQAGESHLAAAVPQQDEVRRRLARVRVRSTSDIGRAGRRRMAEEAGAPAPLSFPPASPRRRGPLRPGVAAPTGAGGDGEAGLRPTRPSVVPWRSRGTRPSWRGWSPRRRGRRDPP